MFNKKAQSQIITTVLIILLVLAAIVIVWQVIQTTVIKSTDTIEEQTSCIGLNLEITNEATTLVDGDDGDTDLNDLEIKVTRKSGGPNDPLTLVLLVDGVTTNYGANVVIGELESRTLKVDGTYTNAPGKVEVGGKVGDVACEYLACSGTDC